MRTIKYLLIAAMVAVMLSPAFPILVFAGDRLKGDPP